MDRRRENKQKRGNKIRINESLKQKATAFKYQISTLLKDDNFKKRINEIKNELMVEIRYDTADSVDNALQSLNKLLFNFRFVSDKNILNGRGILRANKTRLTQLSTGKLTKMQCRPFKSGVALVLEVGFVNKLRYRIVDGAKVSQKIPQKTIKISMEYARKEDENYNIIDNVLWQGSEDELHKKSDTNGGAFDNVVIRKRVGLN